MIMIRNHRSSVMNKWRAARRNRRGSIALWTALTLPGLFAVLALGVEVSTWESTKVALQRTADMAAMAGVMNYNASGNATTASNAAAHCNPNAARSWRLSPQRIVSQIAESV